LNACDDLHAAGRRLINDEVDIILRLAEIGLERFGVLVEAHEPEAAILLEAGRSSQPMVGLVEGLGIGILSGHPDELAVAAVGPAVIDAHEAARVTLPLGADDRTAMTAGVEQAVNPPLLVPAEDHRPAGDLARSEVARRLQFGGMPDIDPA